jgi:hypothetical protein
MGGAGVHAVATGRERCMEARFSLQSRPKSSSDARHKPLDAARMDDEAIRRAALITLRRAICERFPPGAERRAWLRSLERLAAPRNTRPPTYPRREQRRDRRRTARPLRRRNRRSVSV